jgi:hypothetical protein
MGMITSYSSPMPGNRRVIHFTVASDTLPTDMVLVSRIGVSRRPHSTTWVRPETSPAPLSTKEPASTRLEKIGSGGRIAVTPVRTGPSPTTSGPSPSMRVVWPTRTPGTSVMALAGPVGTCPMEKPRTRKRERMANRAPAG